MSNPKKQILLSSIYQEILKEIGDLQNIKPYPFTTFGRVARVHTSRPEQIEIFYEEISEYVETSSIPPVYNPEDAKIIAFGFDINGVQTQYKKSSYGELMKIIATVVAFAEKIVPSLLQEYGESTIFVIASQSKDSDDFSNDPQKDILYHQTLIRKLPSSFRRNQVLLKTFSGGSKPSIVFQKIK